MGNNATNTADNVVFSKDQLFSFARDAIIGHGMLGANAPGMSEQLWAGLKDSRKPAFADDVRDSFDAWVEEQPKSVAKKLAGWKKGSPLSARLSNCRKVAEFTVANPDKASEVYALESLKLAYAFVNKAKRDTKGDATATGGEGDSSAPAEIVVEADADAAVAILADVRAYLAAASEADRLAMLCELESIING